MLAKVLVLTAALFLVVFYKREIVSWFRVHEDLLAEVVGTAPIWGLLAWLSFYGLFEMGEWFVPGIFGREPSGIKTLAACIIASGLAAFITRSHKQVTELDVQEYLKQQALKRELFKGGSH